MSDITLTYVEAGAIEVLRQAQAELVVRGRTTGSLERPNGEVCALGAILAANGGVAFSSLARRALNRVAKDYYDWVSPYSDVGTYTTVNDVIYGGDVVDEEDDEAVLEDFDAAIALIQLDKLR